MDNIQANYLIADRGYDSNKIMQKAESLGMEAVIPSKKNRIVQREHNKDLYRHRHLVENAFLHIKRWRGVATRFAKNSSSFLAIIQIRCLMLWAKLL